MGVPLCPPPPLWVPQKKGMLVLRKWYGVYPDESIAKKPSAGWWAMLGTVGPPIPFMAGLRALLSPGLICHHRMAAVRVASLGTTAAGLRAVAPR